MADSARPDIATIMGIVEMAWGGIWFIKDMFGLYMAFAYGIAAGFLLILDIGLMGMLLASGIMLVKNKKTAIDVNRYYVFGSAGTILILIIYLIVTLGTLGLLSSFITVLLKSIFPALVFILVVINDEVTGFYAAQQG